MNNLYHVGFRKKVEKLAKKKGCELVGEWIKSMVNHLYWAAMSTEDGDSEVITEKWLSLVNHIHNKHKNHGKVYQQCAHGRLKRKWFKYREYIMYCAISIMPSFTII